MLYCVVAVKLNMRVTSSRETLVALTRTLHGKPNKKESCLQIQSIRRVCTL